jgi:hypothetical protein
MEHGLSLLDIHTEMALRIWAVVFHAHRYTGMHLEAGNVYAANTAAVRARAETGTPTDLALMTELNVGGHLDFALLQALVHVFRGDEGMAGQMVDALWTHLEAGLDAQDSFQAALTELANEVTP